MGLPNASVAERYRGKRTVDLMPYCCLAAILLIATGLRLCCLTAESFRFDETYSVAFAQRPLGDFSLFRLEGPPFTDRNLYHLLLHFWLMLGRSDIFIRLLSVILGIGCVLVLHLLAAELFDGKAGLWGALLLAVSPFHIWYSQEVRMYILVSLLTLLSARFSLRVLDISGRQAGPRLWGGWVGYVLCTAAALYTHFFSAFVILAQNVFVGCLILTRQASWHTVRKWLLMQMGVLVLAVPLLRGLILQQQMGWWAWIDVRYGRPMPFDLMDTAVTFSYGATLGGGRIQRWVGMLAFMIAIIVGIFVGRSRRRGSGAIFSLDPPVWFCLFWLLLPIALIYVFSQPFIPGNRNMYVMRYLLPFLAPFLLLAGRGIARLPNTIWRVGLIAIILFVSGRSLHRAYDGEQKENWRGVTEYVAQRFRVNDLVFLVDEDIRVPFDYYWSADAGGANMPGGDTVKVWPVWRGVTETEKLEVLAEEAVRHHDRIWLVLSHTSNRGLETVLDQRPELERMSQKCFTGIDLALYEKTSKRAGA